MDVLQHVQLNMDIHVLERLQYVFHYAGMANEHLTKNVMMIIQIRMMDVPSFA